MSNDIVKLAVVLGVGALVGTQFLAAKVPGVEGAAKTLPAVEAKAAPEPLRSGNRTELRADGLGHFRAQVEIDQSRLAMLVDTGASMISLSFEDAASVGIHPSPSDFTMSLNTANGVAHAAPVRLHSVRLGPIELRDVEAIVATRGALGQSLLGMSFLRKLESFQIAGGNLILRQ